jgi:hypothetical protein
LKEDWDMLNKQATELKNIISRSDNENQSIKSNYIKIIEDREQQLKELILDRSRLKDQYQDELNRSKNSIETYEGSIEKIK